MDDLTLEALESRPFEAIDRQRFASRIRTSVHNAVEGALAAHVEASPAPRATRAARGSAGDPACTRARDARAGRARAFLRMAGVH